MLMGYSTCHSWGPTGLTACQVPRGPAQREGHRDPFPSRIRLDLPSLEPPTAPALSPTSRQEYQGSATLFCVP